MDDPIPATPSTDPAPKPRRTWLWIVAVVLVLALAGGGYAAWTFTQAQALAAARAAAAIDVEVRWDAVSASLATIADVTKQVGSMTTDDASATVPALLSSLKSMESSAGAAIAAMEKDVVLLPEGDAKSDYVIAVKDARDAVLRAMSAAPSIAPLPDFYRGTATASTRITRARKRMNSAIAACNSRHWGKAYTSASGAVSDCEAAASALKKMQASVNLGTTIMDTGEIALGLKAVAAQRRIADAALNVARVGRSRAMSRYNSAIRAYNKVAFASDKLEVPTFFTGPVTFAIQALDKLRSAGDNLTAANSFHEKALRASLARP